MQNLLSLQYKNFLVPVGVGFMLWVLSIGMFSWEYSFLLPYVHCGLDFMQISGHTKRNIPINLQLLTGAYSVVFILAGYILYRTKKVKG